MFLLITDCLISEISQKNFSVTFIQKNKKYESKVFQICENVLKTKQKIKHPRKCFENPRKKRLAFFRISV